MPPALQILHEDNHIIAINKPPGMLSQKDKSGDASAIEHVKAHIKQRDKKPGAVFIGLPHRLDRPVSGVLLLAKTSKALSRLSGEFRDRQPVKLYWALVETEPELETGELRNWLKRNRATNVSRPAPPGSSGAREAVLRYRIMGHSTHYCLLEILLLSGRHHQIRAQLSAAGWPIKGDRKYGAQRSNGDGSIHLHAHSLAFLHPVRRENLKIIASPPEDPLWDCFREKSGEPGEPGETS